MKNKTGKSSILVTIIILIIVLVIALIYQQMRLQNIQKELNKYDYKQGTVPDFFCQKICEKEGLQEESVHGWRNEYPDSWQISYNYGCICQLQPETYHCISNEDCVENKAYCDLEKQECKIYLRNATSGFITQSK